MAAGDKCVHRQAAVDVVVLVGVISTLESRSFTHHSTTSSVAVTYAVCFFYFCPALSAVVCSALVYRATLRLKWDYHKTVYSTSASASPHSPLSHSHYAHILCRLFNSFFCLCHWQATSTHNTSPSPPVGVGVAPSWGWPRHQPVLSSPVTDIISMQLIDNCGILWHICKQATRRALYRLAHGTGPLDWLLAVGDCLLPSPLPLSLSFSLSLSLCVGVFFLCARQCNWMEQQECASNLLHVLQHSLPGRVDASPAWTRTQFV